jgi:hypothetical protein
VFTFSWITGPLSPTALLEAAAIAGAMKITFVVNIDDVMAATAKKNIDLCGYILLLTLDILLKGVKNE